MIEEVYNDARVFRTARGEFFEYKEHEKDENREYIVSKLKPEIENEFLAFYQLPREHKSPYQIMMAKEKNGVAKEIKGYGLKPMCRYQYKLLGEDFAFGYRDRGGWGYNGEDHWFVVSKNKDGQYENITKNLHDGYEDINDVFSEYGVLSVYYPTPLGETSNIGSKHFVKKDGEYERISEDEVEKITETNRPLIEEYPTNWQPVSNLGKENELEFYKMLQKRGR